MKRQCTLTWAARSEVGRTRADNEDAYCGAVRLDQVGGTPRGLFIVCDGMGGHADGQEASALALSVLKEQLDPVLSGESQAPPDLASTLEEAVLQANQALFDRNEQGGREGKGRAGTTVVLLVVSDATVWIAHVGDSRVYQTTRETTRLLTVDHNIGNREIRRGINPDEAWSRADADQLTQALGPLPSEHVRPDIRSIQIGEDALFLLCTDGVSDNDFVERHARELLRPLVDAHADLVAGCERLVEAANRINGHDNLTAILVRISQDIERTDGDTPDAVTKREAPETITDVRPRWFTRLGRALLRRRR